MKALGGSGGMLPRKIFENLNAVMAILVLFEYFSRKFCLNFLILILKASPIMMHFVRTFSIMRASGVTLIAIEEVENSGKIVYIKNIFENGWWRKHTPHLTPLDPPLAISYRNHQKSVAYMFQSLGTIILFFFTKKRSQKGGGGIFVFKYIWRVLCLSLIVGLYNEPPLNSLLLTSIPLILILVKSGLPLPTHAN